MIFVDEAGVNLAMVRRYGRAPRGCRAYADKPVNKGVNLTLVGALGLSGVRAIMELEGPINGNAFTAPLSASFWLPPYNRAIRYGWII